jgi:hypothetical protein
VQLPQRAARVPDTPLNAWLLLAPRTPTSNCHTDHLAAYTDKAPNGLQGTNTSHSPSKPTIASQLDEIREVLAAIPAPLEDTPAVTAFCTLSTSSTHLSSSPAVLDWSALPAAVDADSTGMGVSTRKKAAYKPAKRPVDLEKVQARVARKRAQVGVNVIGHSAAVGC